MKKCNKCGEIKPLSEFGKDKSKNDGLNSKCKKCCNEYQQCYRKNNSRKENDERYRNKNRDKVRACGRNWRLNNPNYKKDRFNNDLDFRIRDNISTMTRNALARRSGERAVKTKELLGITGQELFDRLISFGYNPETDHIDHIVPLSKFDLKQEDHKLVAAHYINIQTLPKEINLKKQNKLQADWRGRIMQICTLRKINYEPIIKHIESQC